MAIEKAGTIAITEAAAVAVTCPTEPATHCMVLNIGANPVWIQHKSGASATATGDNCECVLPGYSTQIAWRDAKNTYSMRAQTADSSINIVNDLGRA